MWICFVGDGPSWGNNWNLSFINANTDEIEKDTTACMLCISEPTKLTETTWRNLLECKDQVVVLQNEGVKCEIEVNAKKKIVIFHMQHPMQPYPPGGGLTLTMKIMAPHDEFEDILRKALDDVARRISLGQLHPFAPDDRPPCSQSAGSTSSSAGSSNNSSMDDLIDELLED